MGKKQSSIEWYENRLIELDIDFGGHKNYWIERKKIRDQVYQMEKEQIQDAYRRGFISDDIKLADDYYNETFGGEN